MASIKFKYNINHIISYQPKWLTLEMITEHIEKAGIPARTFYRDRAIKAEEGEDIPGERLMIYSKAFSVTVDSLFNYTKKVKQLPQTQAPSESIHTLMKRTGLKLPNR